MTFIYLLSFLSLFHRANFFMVSAELEYRVPYIFVRMCLQRFLSALYWLSVSMVTTHVHCFQIITHMLVAVAVHYEGTGKRCVGLKAYTVLVECSDSFWIQGQLHTTMHTPLNSLHFMGHLIKRGLRLSPLNSLTWEILMDVLDLWVSHKDSVLLQKI